MPYAPPTLHQRRRGTRPTAPVRTTAARKIRNSSRWQRFRKWFLNRHPLCCDPFGNHKRDGGPEAATCVHHIVGLVVAPDLAFDEDNAAALCTRCHAQIEVRERRGERTRQLFQGGKGVGARNASIAAVLSHPTLPESINAAVSAGYPPPSNAVQNSLANSPVLRDSTGGFHG